LLFTLKHRAMVLSWEKCINSITFYKANNVNYKLLMRKAVITLWGLYRQGLKALT